MSAEIISQSGSELTIEVKVSLKESMLESEQSILDCVNEVGTLISGEALKQFDADGKPIVVGEVKFTSRCESEKNYQTPYGVIRIERHVYQTSKGGKVYIPLESGARIIQGATPRFAKILTHKYSNLSAPSVIEDLGENHGREIALSYLQNVTDYVGSVAQAKEECGEYDHPPLDKPVSAMGISVDGAYILSVNEGYREGMVGTLTLYDKYRHIEAKI